MRVEEATLHYFVDLNTEIFRGGHFLGEFFHRIQILVIEAREHFPFDEAVEIGEVADHSGSLIDLAADGYFEDVVVSVTVGIVALSVDRLILGVGHRFAVEAVRRGEQVAAGEMSFHNQLLASASSS
jgi:hypothetical protein